MKLEKVTGDEIVALLGVSESDDRMLDLFEKLGVDKDEFERDEDDGSFRVSLWDEIGIGLKFYSDLPEKYKKPEYIGGQYLISIGFEYSFKSLPYGLTDEDDLKTVEKKLGKKANYISIEDDSSIKWMYEDLGWLSVEFEDNTLESIYSLGLRPYENPLEDWDGENGFSTIIEPLKR